MRMMALSITLSRPPLVIRGGKDRDIHTSSANLSKSCQRILFSFVFAFLILTLFFILAPAANALDVPKLQGRVNDYAGMISPQTKSSLEQQLKALEETDSTQIVIVTIPSLQGEVLEVFSIKIAEAWKIGQKGKDNGVILLVSKNDRKIRIEVGRGLEGTLTDLQAGRIIDYVITPRFKEGNFDGGFSGGISAIIAAIKGEFKVTPVPGSFPTETGIPTFMIVLIIVVYIAIFFFGKISKILGSGMGAFFTPLAAGMLFPSPITNVTKLLFALLGLGIGYMLSILASERFRFPTWGVYSDMSSWSFSSSRSSSSGDSSYSSGSDFSGGGGSFGGGGSSGSW